MAEPFFNDPTPVNPVQFAAFEKLAIQDDVEKIKTFLSENPGLFQLSDGKKHTVLHYAAGIGAVNTTKWLLGQQDTPIEAVDIDGRTSFHIAALNGHASVVDAMLHNERLDPHASDVKGFTALHLATRNGKFEVCQKLVEAEAPDINARDEEGKTALHYAVIFNQLEIAELLITRADTNVLDCSRQSAFDIVAKAGTSEMCEIFKTFPFACQHYGDHTPIHIASSRGNINFLRKFQHMNFFAFDRDGNTPLSLAFCGSSMEKNEVLNLFMEIYVSKGLYENYVAMCRGHGDSARAKRCLEWYCVKTKEDAEQLDVQDPTPPPPGNESIKDLPLELWDEVISWMDPDELTLPNLKSAQLMSFHQAVIQRIRDQIREIRTALDVCPYVIGRKVNYNCTSQEIDEGVIDEGVIDEGVQWAGRCENLIEKLKSWKAYENEITLKRNVEIEVVQTHSFDT